jgi:hypothetical protein
LKRRRNDSHGDFPATPFTIRDERCRTRMQLLVVASSFAMRRWPDFGDFLLRVKAIFSSSSPEQRLIENRALGNQQQPAHGRSQPHGGKQQ